MTKSSYGLCLLLVPLGVVMLGLSSVSNCGHQKQASSSEWTVASDFWEESVCDRPGKAVAEDRLAVPAYHSLVWKFSELHSDDLRNGLRVRLRIEPYRIVSPTDREVNSDLECWLTIHHPGRQSKSLPIHFMAKMMTEVELEIPGRLNMVPLRRSGRVQFVELSEVCSNGELLLAVECMEPENYIGAGPRDVTLRRNHLVADGM